MRDRIAYPANAFVQNLARRLALLAEAAAPGADSRDSKGRTSVHGPDFLSGGQTAGDIFVLRPTEPLCPRNTFPEGRRDPGPPAQSRTVGIAGSFIRPDKRSSGGRRGPRGRRRGTPRGNESPGTAATRGQRPPTRGFPRGAGAWAAVGSAAQCAGWRRTGQVGKIRGLGGACWGGGGSRTTEGWPTEWRNCDPTSSAMKQPLLPTPPRRTASTPLPPPPPPLSFSPLPLFISERLSQPLRALKYPTDMRLDSRGIAVFLLPQIKHTHQGLPPHPSPLAPNPLPSPLKKIHHGLPPLPQHPPLPEKKLPPLPKHPSPPLPPPLLQGFPPRSIPPSLPSFTAIPLHGLEKPPTRSQPRARWSLT